tara:strand:+ start:6320 stop:6610 length:291 start_codon:yes stop_codon:yes gene_type:complete
MEQPRNIIDQLTQHIKKNLTKGYNQDTVKYSLMSQGYSKITVERALENANKQLAESVPIIKEKPQISYKIIADTSQPIQISEDSNKKKGFWKKIFK